MIPSGRAPVATGIPAFSSAKNPETWTLNCTAQSWTFFCMPFYSICSLPTASGWQFYQGYLSLHRTKTPLNLDSKILLTQRRRRRGSCQAYAFQQSQTKVPVESSWVVIQDTFLDLFDSCNLDYITATSACFSRNASSGANCRYGDWNPRFEKKNWTAWRARRS